MAGRISAATERALARVAKGEPVGEAARNEDVDRSTLFRALARLRESGDTLPGGRTLIAGAGALGRELANWMRRSDSAAPVAFLDDMLSISASAMTATQVLERGIAGPIDMANVRAGDAVFLAVADPAAREAVATRLAGAAMQAYVDPAAILNGARMGPGCLLFPGSLLSDGAELGRHVVVNTFSSIGHDCVVGDFCTFASYVCLCGRVKVGKRVFFGAGAVVQPDVTIGDDAVIGIGAVVLRDVPAGGKVFGNPARAIA